MIGNFEKGMLKSRIKAINFGDEVEVPEQDEVFFLISLKRIAFIDLIEILKNKIGEEVEEMYISTWVINIPSVERLCRWLDFGEVKKIKIITGTIDKSYRKEVVDFLRNETKKRKLEHTQIKNHSKLVIFKTKNHSIVINGSGNLSDNTLIEQFNIFNNSYIFDFFKYLFDNNFFKDEY